MKRKPLSMRRLHILTAEYLIHLGIDKGGELQQDFLNFLKYVWEHKDDDLEYLFGELKEPKKVLHAEIKKRMQP